LHHSNANLSLANTSRYWRGIHFRFTTGLPVSVYTMQYAACCKKSGRVLFRVAATPTCISYNHSALVYYNLLNWWQISQNSLRSVKYVYGRLESAEVFTLATDAGARWWSEKFVLLQFIPWPCNDPSISNRYRLDSASDAVWLLWSWYDVVGTSQSSWRICMAM
jgi:hypothetical protein